MIEQKDRYWLNNAHAYLKKFQRQKLYEHNISRDTMNEKQKTFDQCQIPSSKQSPQKTNKIKIKQQISQNLNMKKKNVQNVYVTSSILEHQSDAVEENIVEAQQNQKIDLSDLIIRQHLTKTLKVYQKDLIQLQQNRDNLIQAIEEITSKIQNLNELQSKNQILQLQNFKNKRQIFTLIRQYHDLKLNTTRKKIKINQDLLKKKNRIKTLIQIYPQQTELVVQTESFNYYQSQLYQNKKITQQKPLQSKVIKQIFPQIEGEPEKPKIKQKQKSKLVDKAGLLGDLKSFAKNFKMPNSNANDV